MTPLRLSLPAPASGRLRVLDELKGVAMILVLLYHAGGVLGPGNGMHGEVGVDLFVVLSGIGLALSSSSATEGAGRFLIRRFWRIYPAYWIVLTAFLGANRLLFHRPVQAVDIGLHYLGIHLWFGDRYALSVNDSFWFITLIVSLYLLYLPLRRFVGRPDVLLFLGALVSLALSAVYFKEGQSVGFDHFSLRFPGFFIGLLIGRLLKTGTLEIALTPALGAAGLLIFYVPYTLGYVFASVWVGLSLMLAYAFLLRPELGGASRGLLKYVGDRSLEIFLIHQPLIREFNVYALRRWFPGADPAPWALAAGMGVALGVTLVLAAGLHRLLRPVTALGAAPAP